MKILRHKKPLSKMYNLRHSAKVSRSRQYRAASKVTLCAPELGLCVGALGVVQRRLPHEALGDLTDKR